MWRDREGQKDMGIERVRDRGTEGVRKRRREGIND